MSSVADPMSRTHPAPADRTAVASRIADLGEWFHNLNLNGVLTAPDHFLGDFPNYKWKRFSHAIPEDLRGATVLDIGCNAGFYSIQMKQRGAERVLAVDVDARYLNQARFASQTLGLDIEFEQRSVYQVDEIPGQFDYVLFMGLFYHLRYPLFALDHISKKVRGKLVFQTMIRGSECTQRWDHDYPFSNTEIFRDPNFPAMFFVEHSYAHDYTNWWIPNCGAVEAMLRSSGFELEAHPEPEIWICSPTHVQRNARYLLDLELEGTL
jgi:tRNA (mo5U34)-methyltransferase